MTEPEPERVVVRWMDDAPWWPLVWFDRDVWDRLALHVVVPRTCVVSVFTTLPVPGRWRQFPPWTWRRTWYGWERRRRIRG